jgi:iron complex transport system substrate-binding protein
MVSRYRPCNLPREIGGLLSGPNPRIFCRPGLTGAAAIAAVGIMLGLFAGCSRQFPSSHAYDKGGSGRVEYTDGLGRRVALPQRPVRIISLAPSVTEVVYLLKADDRLIGVTTHCDWPEDARSKPKIGTLLTPNYEAVLAARPDLIIASTAGNDRAAVYKLAELGLPVYVTAPRSVSGIFETTLAIGRITGCNEQAERLVADMRARLDEVRRRLAGLPPVRAFFITWFEPLLAPGRRTFENDVLGLAGVASISAASEEYYPRYSLEQILSQNPDVILTVTYPGNLLPDLESIAGWRELGAVKHHRVYVLSDVLQHPSPRFVDGVEELARTLHPERFQ